MEDEDRVQQTDHSEQENSRQPAPRPKKSSIICNVSDTKYSVVKRAARRDLNWKLSRSDTTDWDITWTDNGVTTEALSRMKPYQRINHFPGMYAISRKNFLALNLNKLKKLFPAAYKFYPRTWLVPSDLSELKANKKNKVYIAKPEASSQGKGIFLIKKIDDFTFTDRYVVQEYLKKPLLIDGLKFDFRI